MEAEPRNPAEQDKRRFSPVFLMSAVAVAAIVGGLIFINRANRDASTSGAAKLPFGAGERAYAPQIQLGGMEMSRAANFLNQEVTYLSGVARNQGDRGLREIEVTVEFRDALNQVVLREARSVLGARAAPLGPGQSRAFQLSFDHVPTDWNLQLPGVRVTGLVFE